MIFGNTELHNADGSMQESGKEGVRLKRVPEHVLAQIGPETAAQYRLAAGSEIRFVSDWKPVKLTLSSLSGDVQAYLYFGDFAAGRFTVTSRPTPLEISLPFPSFLSRSDFAAGDFSFAPQVCRVLFQTGEIHLHEADGEYLRPPDPGEVPALRYLAYGSSITQGIAASHPALAYVNQAGSRLGAGVMNMGAAGNAFCEEPLAQYFAARNDWDFASLCISINMLGRGISSGEFKKAAGRMVRIMAERQPGKPIVCIGLLPSLYDIGFTWPDRQPVSTPEEYRQALYEVVEDLALPNVYYIDGRRLLPGLQGLSHDLLHPADDGMIRMGENLARLVRPLINGFRTDAMGGSNR